jgi:hypothetical protein
VIGAKRVTAPDGTEWRVGRRWLPDWPRIWDRRDRGDGDGSGIGDALPDLDGIDEAFAVALVVIGVVLVVLLFTTVVFPIVALTIELLLVVVLLIGGLVGRLVFRRPWTVRARASDDRRELTWHVRGLRRSGRVRDEVAAALASGRTDIRPADATPTM